MIRLLFSSSFPSGCGHIIDCLALHNDIKPHMIDLVQDAVAWTVTDFCTPRKNSPRLLFESSYSLHIGQVLLSLFLGVIDASISCLQTLLDDFDQCLPDRFGHLPR